MQNKYRIIETEHADGSFSYVAEVGKPVLTGIKAFPNVEYVWEKVSIFPCDTLQEAKDKIENHKANKTVKNKIVYEE